MTTSNDRPMIDVAPASVQRTAYRCGDCRARFRMDMLVNVPIDQYVAQMRSVRCPSCGSGKIMLGESRTMSEDAAERGSGDERSRAAHWLANGETGLSSKALHRHMTGAHPREMTAPSDLDDMRRCILLLQHVPEWSARIGEMARYPAWSALAPAWNDVVESYLRESPNLDGPAPEAAALMRKVTR